MSNGSRAPVSLLLLCIAGVLALACVAASQAIGALPCEGDCIAEPYSDSELGQLSLLQTSLHKPIRRSSNTSGLEGGMGGAAQAEWQAPSSSAIGCMTVRWKLYSEDSLPQSWTDACFSSVVHGNIYPNESVVKQWMQAPCTCDTKSTPAPMVLSNGVPLLDGLIGIVEKQNHDRTMAIDHIMDMLLLETPSAQVVTLGAGFDGRFYRMASLRNASQLFEMDVVSTQGLKHALVQNCNMKPANGREVHYLPLDLSKDDVYESLFNDRSFDATQPTIFLTEDVLQYVPEEGVLKALKVLSHALRQNSASRLIVKSFVSFPSDVRAFVNDDEVLFGFPANQTTREAWWAALGLTPDHRPDMQIAMDSYEFLDVLAASPTFGITS